MTLQSVWVAIQNLYFNNIVTLPLLCFEDGHQKRSSLDSYMDRYIEKIDVVSTRRIHISVQSPGIYNLTFNKNAFHNHARLETFYFALQTPINPHTIPYIHIDL